jgi:hypothetical protein
MPGKEALDHIRETDKCSLSDAIQRLRSAISDGKVNARLLDPRLPGRMAIFPPWAEKTITFYEGPPTPMLSPGSRQIPARNLWAKAKIRVSGTVRFFNNRSPWYKFEVLRANVLRIWPERPGLSLRSSSRGKPRSIVDVVREAIDALWEGNIPAGLRAKDRNNQIAEWLKHNNRSVPAGSAGLPKAVQRAMKRVP